MSHPAVIVTQTITKWLVNKQIFLHIAVDQRISPSLAPRGNFSNGSLTANSHATLFTWLTCRCSYCIMVLYFIAKLYALFVFLFICSFNVFKGFHSHRDLKTHFYKQCLPSEQLNIFLWMTYFMYKTNTAIDAKLLAAGFCCVLTLLSQSLWELKKSWSSVSLTNS